MKRKVQKTKEWVLENEAVLSMVAFVGGFVFDLLTLGRIDQAFSLMHQCSLLLALMFLLTIEHRRQQAGARWKPWVSDVWEYHELALQFLMGTLLSAYTIFYFKSASDIMVNIYFILLVVLLFLNEKKGLDRSKFPVRFWMMSLCISSYFIYAVPILIGSMSVYVFVLSMGLSVLIYFLWMKFFFKSKNQQALFREPRLWAGIVMPLLLIGLYMAKLIPPVPLATMKMGIYHGIDKKNGMYTLTYKDRSQTWKFWKDPIFYAQEDDRLYFFASIFAPTDFEHTMKVQWLLKDANGQWQKTDSIPINIHGGRQEGFRGFTYKQNYQSGQWRVRLLTQTDQELSHYDFDVLPENQSSEEIRWETEKF